MNKRTVVYDMDSGKVVACRDGDAMFESDAYKAALLSHGICPDEAKQEYLDALEFEQEKAPI